MGIRGEITMKVIINGKIEDVELSSEEIAKMQAEQRKAEIIERTRPFAESEVSRMIIAAQINALEVDDGTALRMASYYPEWEVGKSYEEGFKVQYSGDLYKVTTAHTSQSDWTPDVAATLFTRIDENHAGTEDDPIPYDGNMALEEGKYYVQGDVVYRCTRDTGSPVYASLWDLIELYVEVVQ